MLTTPPQAPRTHDRETPRGEEGATSSVSTHVTTPRRTRPARPACSEAGVGKDTPAPTLLPPRRTGSCSCLFSADSPTNHRPLRSLGGFPHATPSWGLGEHPSPGAGRLRLPRFPAPPDSGLLGVGATERWCPSPSPSCRSRKGSEGGPEAGGKGQPRLPRSCLLPRGDSGSRAGETLG